MCIGCFGACGRGGGDVRGVALSAAQTRHLLLQAGQGVGYSVEVSLQYIFWEWRRLN